MDRTAAYPETARRSGRGRLLGINSELLAQTIDAFVSGITVTKVRDGNYLVDVIARADAHGRVLAAALRTLAVPLPNGATVPPSQLAKVEYGQDWPLIWRRDRVPTLTVQSDVVAGALPATVVHDLRLQIDRLNRRLPPGYSVTAGGSEEESNKSLNSVIAVVPVAGLLMLIVLMAQLQNLSQLFLVISVVPFGLIGVVAALLIAHKPLGFVAILGVLSLTGMIIRNSVILVDQIGREIVGHRTPWDAVIEATAHRCRPILLTAAAAILGMIPIASTVFWGPMAYAIMGGLAIATILTLVFLPALYVAWFNIREDRPRPGLEWGIVGLGMLCWGTLALFKRSADPSWPASTAWSKPRSDTRQSRLKRLEQGVRPGPVCCSPEIAIDGIRPHQIADNFGSLPMPAA
jgi:multidrug efflux pump subunit AcrB